MYMTKGMHIRQKQLNLKARIGLISMWPIGLKTAESPFYVEVHNVYVTKLTPMN